MHMLVLNLVSAAEPGERLGKRRQHAAMKCAVDVFAVTLLSTVNAEPTR